MMGWWYYGPGSGTGGGWVGGLIVLIMMVLFWGGLITVAVLFVRRFARPAQHTDSARRILTERRDKLETVTRRLLDVEVMEGEELRRLLGAMPSAMPGLAPPAH